MNKLPVLSGDQVVRVLELANFRHCRTRGSHAAMVRLGESPITVIVPLHRELDRGTLRAIIRQSGLSVDKFLELLATL